MQLQNTTAYISDANNASKDLVVSLSQLHRIVDSTQEVANKHVVSLVASDLRLD